MKYSQYALQNKQQHGGAGNKARPYFLMHDPEKKGSPVESGILRASELDTYFCMYSTQVICCYVILSLT